MSLKLSIDAIETIDAISRKGSFSAAASELNKVPSALTYQMKKLEKDLNVALFNRNGYRTTLTEAGQALLIEGRYLLEKAQEVQAHVQRIATGIETTITIAVSDLFQTDALFKTLQDFYKEDFGTQIKVTQEVYGGSWDALASNRADISFGAPGDSPPDGSYASKTIGNLEVVFAIAPNHPLATADEPLSGQDIMHYRISAVADSSKNLPVRTSGILSGQEVLTLPDMKTKISSQLLGLTVGYLPKGLAESYAKENKLVIKSVKEPKAALPLHVAWRKQKIKMGPAQTWLIKRFSQYSLDELLLTNNAHTPR